MSGARIVGLLGIVLAISGLAFSATVPVPQVVEAAGARQGICVVVGEGACDFALDLAQGSELLIYLQSTQAKDFEAACRKVEEAGYYGSRIFVGRDAQKLHLAGNVADVVVALGSRPGFSDRRDCCGLSDRQGRYFSPTKRRWSRNRFRRGWTTGLTRITGRTTTRNRRTR